jgi:hypothetical protein
MKKFKKNLSKTVFASFFIFQFVVSTAFMPVAVNAEDILDNSSENVSEETVSTEPSVAEESPVETSEFVAEEGEPLDVVAEEKTEESSVAGGNNGGGHTQVQICHASGQSGNFQVLTVDDDGTFGGHGNHENDIRPITDLNGDNVIDVADCTYTPTQGQYVDGVLKVCKVIIDEDGNIVSDWSAYSDSTFGTTLTLQGSQYNFNFNSNDTLSGGYNFSTVCKTQNVSVNVANLNSILFVKYEEEVIGGTTPFIANYFEGDAGETGLYNSQGGAMFDEFNTGDAAYDGQFELNENPNTGFSGTLFLVNEEQKSEDLGGSIKVCKIIIDKDSMIVEDWSTLPGTNTFAINFLGKPETLNSSFNEAGIPSSVVFDTATGNVNDSIFEWSKDGKTLIQDANCVMRSGLDFGNYFYDEEVVDGDNLSDWNPIVTQPGQTQYPEYYDGGNGQPIEDFNSFSAYDDTLFTDGDAARNTNSDGHIVLTEQNPNRTLVVMNRYKGDLVDPSNNSPVITVNPIEVCLPRDTTYDFMSGVTASDVEDGDLTSSVDVNIGNFVLGVPGVYTITYTVTDSDKNVDTATRTIIIKDNCGDEPEGPSCEANGDEIWAKITILDLEDLEEGGVSLNPDNTEVLTSNPYNEGAGDLQSRIYVGSNSEYKNSGEWFMVHDGTNPVIDATPFEDNVPGIAVQRVDGEVRFGIYGSHDERRPQNYERVVGTIEFFQGRNIGDWYSDIGDNKVDGAEVAVPDFIQEVSNNVLYFDLGVDVANDFLYAPYTFNPCDDGGDDGDDGDDDGDDNGGGGGGGSSGGGSRRRSEGEVLGATSCVAFTTYNRLGNKGGEIKALQTFLNEYMNAGLTVDGVYGRTTAQAVHDFQAFHWKEVIDPWTPPLSPNTTGWQYKSTRATINAIIDCPEAPVFLEDPAIMYSVTEVENEKPLTAEQIQKIYDLLIEAQTGDVLGAATTNVDALDYSNPNYDLMFGK